MLARSRIPIALVATLALAGAAVAPPARADVGHGRCGDVNLDGRQDVRDVVKLLRFITGLDVPTVEEFLNADLAPVVVEYEWQGRRVVSRELSDLLDVRDLVELLRVVVGLDDVKGCGPSPRCTELRPLESCADGETRAELVGHGLFAGSDAPTVLAGDVEAEVVRLATLDDGSQAVAFRVPLLPGVPQQGAWVLIAVLTPEGMDVAPSPLLVRPACAAAPVVSHVAGAGGHPWEESTHELWGDELACARRVAFVGETSGREVEAAWFTVLESQWMQFVAPPSPGPPQELFDVLVESDCGRSSPAGVSWQWWPNTLPDGMLLTPPSRTGTEIGAGVTISGTNLDAVDRIRFGTETLVRGVHFWTGPNEIVIDAIPPAPDPLLTLQVSVVVENHGAFDATPLVFTYVGAPVPACASFTPASGPVAGGTQVILTTPSPNLVTSVRFGGVAGTDFAVSLPSTVFVRTPPYPLAVDVDVELQRNGVTLSRCPGAFTYVP